MANGNHFVKKVIVSINETLSVAFKQRGRRRCFPQCPIQKPHVSICGSLIDGQVMQGSVAQRPSPKRRKRAGVGPGPSNRSFTETLSRGLEILRCFTPSEPELTHKALSERTGLPKPTVTRLAYTLSELGFLRQREHSRKYQLGSAALAIAYPLIASMQIRHLVRAPMQALAQFGGGVAALFMCERLDIICIEACRNLNAPDGMPDIGTSMSICAGAAGWATLAAHSPARRTELLDEIRATRPDEFARNREGIRSGIESVDTYGYCMSLEEGGACWHVSVPLREPVYGNIMVVTCAVPADKVRSGWLEREVGPRLVNAVRNLSIDEGLQNRVAGGRSARLSTAEAVGPS